MGQRIRQGQVGMGCMTVKVNYLQSLLMLPG